MSPTFEVPAGFAREFARLSREQDRAFRQAVRKLVDALKEGREPPRSLRIKRAQGTAKRCAYVLSGERSPWLRKTMRMPISRYPTAAAWGVTIASPSTTTWLRSRCTTATSSSRST